MAEATNGLDPEELKELIANLDSLDAEMVSSKASHMAFCKGRRDKITSLKKAAKKDGVPIRALEIWMKRRDLAEEAKELMSDLDDEQVETYEQVEDALGGFADTPLGKATLARVAPDTSDMDDMEDDGEDEFDAADPENKKSK